MSREVYLICGVFIGMGLGVVLADIIRSRVK